MTIKTLKKITLYGLTSDKEELLRGLQQLGCLHLIPLTLSAESDSELSEPRAAKEALHWLTSCPIHRQAARSTGDLTVHTLISKVLDNHLQHRKAADRRDALIKRIKEVQPWGEYSFAPLADMAGVRLWFYVVPLKAMAEVQTLDLPYEVVHQNNKSAYVVVLSEQEPGPAILPVKRSHVGRYSLSELEDRLVEAEMTLEDIQGERESLTRWTYVIAQAVARIEDQQALHNASCCTVDDNQFFLLSGWMPADHEQDIRVFCAQHMAAATFEEPKASDSPPTLLESSTATGGGSEAFSFFQVPGYRSWDPGNIVFFAFSLFFAMIMSDAAYCAILAGILALCHSKIGRTEGGHRLLNMGYFMCGLGVIWGVIIGSYFGAAPGPGSALDGLAILDLNNYNAMMALSIVVGVGHLVLASFMNFWINRRYGSSLAHLGWSMAMLGGLSIYLGKSNFLSTTFADPVGPSIMGAGAVLIFLFSSERRVSSVGTLFLRILDGFKGLYNITGAFGDILSYMRLFALGLSGASLAMTFNNLASNALHSTPVTGVLFAGVILLLGHVLNFALCIMSGVVHGMRLNVIEFVNWGMSDEGYPFKAFCKQEG